MNFKKIKGVYKRGLEGDKGRGNDEIIIAKIKRVL